MKTSVLPSVEKVAAGTFCFGFGHLWHRTIRAVTWDMGSDLGQFSGHSRGVNSVDFRPCRPFRLVSSSDDMLVSFYQGPPFIFDHSDPHHKNFVHAVRSGCSDRITRRYSPDGAFYVSVSGDKTINVFEGKVCMDFGLVTRRRDSICAR